MSNEYHLQLFAPIPKQSTNSILRNTHIEFWVKQGTTYYPGGVSEGATGNVSEILSSVAMPNRVYPTTGWRSIAHYLDAIVTAIGATGSLPAGTAASWAIDEETGLVTFTFTASSPITVKLRFLASGSIYTKGTGTTLGFTESTYDYAATQTANIFPANTFSTSWGSGSIEQADDMTTNPNFDQHFALDGSVFQFNIGTYTNKTEYRLTFLSTAQKDQLYSLLQTTSPGWPLFAYFATWDDDAPVGNTFNANIDKESYSNFRLERIDTGLDYFNTTLTIINK